MSDHPANDEIEISVFGPGYGEAILIHIGNGDWIAIDSCIDPKDGSVMPFQYLESLGVALSSQVKLIITTHWHDDHIKGLSNLLVASESAKFCCATAFTKKEFMQFALAHQDADPSLLGKATNEIATILRILHTRKSTPVYLKADVCVFSSKSDPAIEVFSLSPGDDKIHKFLSRIAGDFPIEKSLQRRAGDLSPNDLSIVLQIRFPNGSVLLGGDLEEVPGKGWTTIIDNSVSLRGDATAFKIPHHGSQTGHSSDVWDKLLSKDVVAVLTPWRKGSGFLPSPNDVARILSFTNDAYSTADPSAVSPIRRDSQVAKQLSVMGIKLHLAHPRPGRLTLRRKFSEREWRVKTDGTARHLSKLVSR